MWLMFIYRPRVHVLLDLQLDEGSILLVKNVSLPKASFLKVRAQSVDFLQIKHPRALLEVALRDYTCVTVGDTIKLVHNGKPFFMDVQEVKPNGFASIVETDVEIDFDEPVGYKEYINAQREKGQSPAIASSSEAVPTGAPAATRELQRATQVAADSATESKFVPFAGSGRRIDGKDNGAAVPSSSSSVAGSSSASAAASMSQYRASPAPARASPSVTTPSPVSTTSLSADSGTAPPTTFQSRIGSKYSIKKAGAAAFHGTGNKLN
jgi:ubiquitin fusion degradation protein 1